MKQLATMLLLMTTVLSDAQNPPAYIPYQAIARDASGQVKANAAVTVQFRIYNTMLAATPAYQEQHAATTNDFGYFNLRIGNGTVQSGSFGAITWSSGDVSYEVWADMGSGLSQLGGRTGFMSVPYALYAGNGTPTPTLNINAPNTVTNSSSGNYTINVATPTLSINSNSLSISPGNTVTLPASMIYTAGSDIAISGGVISNTAPNQTVNVTGAGVSGTYPNYTIAATPATTLVAGNQVTLNQSGSTYTVNGVTPTFAAAGIQSITGTYPSMSFSVPASVLSYTAGSNALQLTSGSTVSNVTLATQPSATITGTGLATVSSTAPSYTVAVPTPTMGFNNATGTYSYNQGAYSNTINLSPNLNYTQGTGSGTLSAGSNTALIPGTGIWTKSGTSITNTVLSDNVGIGVSPGYKLSVNEGSAGTPAIYGAQSATATSNNAHGVYGLTGNPNATAAGVYGTSTGTGPGVYGTKGLAYTGNAARFESYNPSNGSEAVYISHAGAGPAVYAVVSNSATGTAGKFDGNVTVNGNVYIPGSNAYKYSSSQTNYLSMSALSFNAEGLYHRSNLAGGIYINDGTAGTQGNFYAGVNLPDGATVVTVDAYVLDNDATASRDVSYVQLWRQTGAVGTNFGSATMLGQTNGTSGASAVIQKITTSSITTPLIDNVNYTYYVRVGTFQANPNLMLFKVVITYTVDKVD